MGTLAGKRSGKNAPSHARKTFQNGHCPQQLFPLQQLERSTRTPRPPEHALDEILVTIPTG